METSILAKSAVHEMMMMLQSIFYSFFVLVTGQPPPPLSPAIYASNWERDCFPLQTCSCVQFIFFSCLLFHSFLSIPMMMMMTCALKCTHKLNWAIATATAKEDEQQHWSKPTIHLCMKWKERRKSKESQCVFSLEWVVQVAKVTRHGTVTPIIHNTRLNIFFHSTNSPKYNIYVCDGELLTFTHLLHPACWSNRSSIMTVGVRRCVQ